jgi:hypothetical protein
MFWETNCHQISCSGFEEDGGSELYCYVLCDLTFCDEVD